MSFLSGIGNFLKNAVGGGDSSLGVGNSPTPTPAATPAPDLQVQVPASPPLQVNTATTALPNIDITSQGSIPTFNYKITPPPQIHVNANPAQQQTLAGSNGQAVAPNPDVVSASAAPPAQMPHTSTWRDLTHNPITDFVGGMGKTIYHDAADAVDVLNAGRQGVQGLANYAFHSGNESGQDILNKTNAATSYSLNASHGLLTPNEAQNADLFGNAQQRADFLNPLGRGVVRYAPYAVAPELGGIGEKVATLAAGTLLPDATSRYLTAAAMGFTSDIANQTAGKALPVAIKYGSGVLGGGLINSAFGASQGFRAGETPMQVLKQTPINFGVGAAIGGGVPAVGNLAKGTVNAIADSPLLGETGFVEPPPVEPLPIDRTQLTGKALDNTNKQLTEPTMVNEVKPATSPPTLSDGVGGAAVGKDVNTPNVDPLPSPKQEALEYKSADELGGKAQRNADAERNVLNDYQEGKSTDEVLYNYQKSTGTDLQTAYKDVGRVRNEAGLENTLDNPLRDNVNITPARDAGDAHLNAEYVHGTLDSARMVAREGVANLTGKDINLLKGIEDTPVEQLAKQADKPADFKQAADQLRTYYNLRDAWDQRLGVEHGYRYNYLRQLISDSNKPPEEPIVARGGNTRPGYAIERTGEGMRTNILDALYREGGATFNLGKLAYEESLKQVYGDGISNSRLPNDGTYESLHTAYGKGLVASPEIAQELNARAAYQRPPGLAAVPGQLYDSVNAFQKGAKFALGVFHDVVTQAAFLGKEFLHTITHPSDVGNLGSAFSPLLSKFSPTYYENLKNSFRNETDAYGTSTWDKIKTSGLTITREETAADAGGRGGGSVLLRGKYNPVKIAHDSLFQRVIPAIKMIMASEEFRNLDIHNPKDVYEMRRIASVINEGIGGINRAVEGLTPNQAHTAGRIVLALDYNEGQIVATLKAITKGGAEGRVAREIIGGKIAIFALPGLIYAAQDPNKRTSPVAWGKVFLQQLVDPSLVTGLKNDKGENKVIKFPGDPAITKGYRIIAPLFDSNQHGISGKSSGLQHELTGNLAALPSSINQLIANKDYYGNKIIVKNSDDSINIPKTVASMALSNAPISVNQVARAIQGKESPLEAGLNIAGFGRTATNPNDPQYVKNQNYFNQQNQYKNDLASGKLSNIDPRYQDVSSAEGAKLLADYNALHPASIQDSAGNNVPGNWNAFSGARRASYYLQNNQSTGAQELSPSFIIDQKQSRLDPSRPHNPIFDLQGNGVGFTLDSNKNVVGSSEIPKAQIALDYQAQPASSDQKALILAANPWLSDYEKQLANSSTNYQQNMTDYMTSQGWNAKAINDYFAKHPNNPAPIIPPTLSPESQSLMDQYSAITDPIEKAKFFQDNAAELATAFAAGATYKNQKAVAQGAYPLQPRPVPTPEQAVALAMLQKNPNHDKTIGKANALLVQAHPELAQYLADSGLFNTAKNLAKYQYQDPTHPGLTAGQLLNLGRPIDQSTLSGVANLGKYDIGKNAAGQYSFMQDGGFSPGTTAGGSKGAGGYSKKVRMYIHHTKLKNRKIKMLHTRKISVAHPKMVGRVRDEGRILPIRLGGGVNDRSIRLV